MPEHKDFVSKWKITWTKPVDIGLDDNTSHFQITPAPGSGNGFVMRIQNGARWNGGPPPQSANPNVVDLTEVDPNSTGGVWFTANGVKISDTSNLVDLNFRIDGNAAEAGKFKFIKVDGTVSSSGTPGKPTGSAGGGRNN